MSPFLLQCIYFALLLMAAVAGAWRWHISDRAARIFTMVMAVTFIAEMIALLLGKLYHTNLTFYRIWTPMELCSYCLYLNYCVPQLQHRAIGWIAGVAGVITAILFDFIFREDLRGARFLMIENVLIICGCLYACFAMLLREDDEPPTRYVHFWLVASLLFFWCFSFLSLSLLSTDPSQKSQTLLLNHLIEIGNIGMLSGVLYTFIRLPKLLPAS